MSTQVMVVNTGDGCQYRGWLSTQVMVANTGDGFQPRTVVNTLDNKLCLLHW